MSFVHLKINEVEFLRFMLDGLSEDLNRVTEKPKWKIRDEEVDQLPDVENARLAWNKCQSMNSSIIFGMFLKILADERDIFGGQLQSTVTCHGCRYRSVTFEMFLDLSLPIPKVMPTKILTRKEIRSQWIMRSERLST